MGKRGGSAVAGFLACAAAVDGFNAEATVRRKESFSHGRMIFFRQTGLLPPSAAEGSPPARKAGQAPLDEVGPAARCGGSGFFLRPPLT